VIIQLTANVMVSSYKVFIDMGCAGREFICSQRGPEKLGKQEEATACSEAFSTYRLHMAS